MIAANLFIKRTTNSSFVGRYLVDGRTEIDREEGECVVTIQWGVEEKQYAAVLKMWLGNLDDLGSFGLVRWNEVDIDMFTVELVKKVDNNCV